MPGGAAAGRPAGLLELWLSKAHWVFARRLPVDLPIGTLAGRH